MTPDFPLSPEEFRSIYSRVPRLCVEVVLKSPKGLVLAKRGHKSWGGQWHIPGGTVLMGESLVEAAKRIAKRELGVTIEVHETMGYIEYPSEQKEVGFGQSVGVALLCTTDAQEFSTSEESPEVRAFVELPEPMIAEHRAFLESHPQWR